MLFSPNSRVSLIGNWSIKRIATIYINYNKYKYIQTIHIVRTPSPLFLRGKGDKLSKKMDEEGIKIFLKKCGLLKRGGFVYEGG